MECACECLMCDFNRWRKAWNAKYDEARRTAAAEVWVFGMNPREEEKDLDCAAAEALATQPAILVSETPKKKRQKLLSKLRRGVRRVKQKLRRFKM